MNINECGCRPYGWLGLDGNRCIRVIPRQLGVGTVDIYETLIPGFPPLLGVGTVDICCEQPTGKGRNVQRLPVPRLHPKQGCQAQIANQTDKGRILQVRRLPLSSPKGQNHLG